MKKLLVLLLPVLVCGAGCANLSALRRASELEREARRERVLFFEKVSDAYFFLGYEYYTLALEAEKQGDGERAEQYRKKAVMYNLFHKDAQDEARRLRERLLQGVDVPPIEPPAESADPPQRSLDPLQLPQAPEALSAR